MDRPSKPIRLSEHAKEQLRFRGGTVGEIEQAIRTIRWEAAELGRQECRLPIPFDAAWNGRRYATKTVRPIFVEEPNAVVVVPVYVYYGAPS